MLENQAFVAAVFRAGKARSPLPNIDCSQDEMIERMAVVSRPRKSGVAGEPSKLDL